MSATYENTTICVEKPEQFRAMPDEYQELALHQMKVHTEGELSGADDYLQVFLPIAPNAEERKVCCERAAEEYDHFIIGSQVLADLGVDTAPMLEQRLRDRQLYATPEIHNVLTWAERGVFSFLGEDAVLDHIKEMAQSSYRPWADSFDSIIRDERVHIAHGERIVRELLRTDEGRAEVQDTIDRHWELLLSLFGSPTSWRSAAYVKWGLRKKTNEQARNDYVARIVPKLDRLGLRAPV